MRGKRKVRVPDFSDAGVTAVTGTLLMIALTVVIATVVFYLAVSLETPQDLTRTSMKILALNSSTIGVTSMIGDPVPIHSVNIIVGPDTYNASSADDRNDNGFWDPGETIFLYGLDLGEQTSVVVATDTQVLMPGMVQWSDNNVPADADMQSDQSANNFISYRPGIRMTAYSDTSFTSPAAATVSDEISYASPDGLSAGYQTSDPSWPESVTGRDHNFSVKYAGYLYIDNNNTYSFRITASDSIEMLIDDSPVINVTGVHAPLTHHAEVYLSAGYHKLEINYRNYNSLAVIGDYYMYKQPDGEYMPPGIFYLEGTDAGSDLA